MDIHVQITIPDDCVTPNVPRIRASFFNRKYRDIKAAPTTPKSNQANIRVTSVTRGRARRSAGSTGNPANKQQAFSPITGNSFKGRAEINDPFDLDFSTPRATRNLLTPPSTNVTKRGKGGRVTHLIYKPLELDNESSSESLDSRRKRTRLEDHSPSPNSKPPLAIAAPPVNQDDSLTEFIDILEVKDKTISEKTTPEIQSKSRVQTRIEPEVESTVEEVNEKYAENTKRVECSGVGDVDDEPEIIEVVPDLPDLPITPEASYAPETSTFVPGNCNIEELLKLFKKRETSSMSNEKMESREPELKKQIKS